ncbi:MAG: TerC family protein [Verrucomicrobiales bacterium]|nr:TerC family protein [Verrucomicrobiales bacterium]MCP5557306.1 TerC family protein [Verrucomicrobiaceae bacterium]
MPVPFLAELNPFDFSWLADPEAWIALLTLTIMEIVLGIDNIVFISILVDKVPETARPRARFLGLGFAMITRILLLLSISWVMQLKEPWFTVIGREISGKDFILIAGGLFLLYKSTKEIHHKIEGDPEGDIERAGRGSSLTGILIQIAVLDLVFSLDSVITAVGMAEHISVMILAVMISVGFMMIFAGSVSSFISKHPTVKMLALSFLMLIGTALVGEGLHFHIPKGYVYFAMAFSIFVEMLNIRASKKKKAAAAGS